MEMLSIADALQLWGVQFYTNPGMHVPRPALKLIKGLRLKSSAHKAASSTAQQQIQMLLQNELAAVDYLLVDTYSEEAMGGLGQTFDWAVLPKDLSAVWLAGGINAENIKTAAALQPFALDLSSSVELAPGIKDHVKLRTLFAALNA